MFGTRSAQFDIRSKIDLSRFLRFLWIFVFRLTIYYLAILPVGYFCKNANIVACRYVDSVTMLPLWNESITEGIVHCFLLFLSVSFHLFLGKRFWRRFFQYLRHYRVHCLNIVIEPAMGGAGGAALFAVRIVDRHARMRVQFFWIVLHSQQRLAYFPLKGAGYQKE